MLELLGIPVPRKALFLCKKLFSCYFIYRKNINMGKKKIKIDKKIVGVGLASEKKVEKEIIIPENVDLPDDAPARMKTLRAEGRKWYLTVVYHPNTEKPFALFCHTNSHEKSAQTSDAVEKLLALAKNKGISEKYIGMVEEKIGGESNTAKVTRTISLLLRHGVLISSIVAEIGNVKDVYVGSFLFQIKKFLSNYILEGSIAVGQVCSECETTLVFSGGCFICPSCGNSKCG
jgi:hypothetical protein